TSTPARLDVVLRDLVGKALGVLHHLVNLWPRQKARTQRLVPDALCQPVDGCCCLPKGCMCLLRLASLLIQASQCRLDLPAFSRQAKVYCYLGRLAQVADGLLALSIPHCQHRQRLQVGKAEAPVGSQTFPQSLHFFSRLALIPPTQEGLRFILSVAIHV